MSNKKLSFVEAVKSGKNFRCVETGEFFKANESFNFYPELITRSFQIVDEVKKELTASEIEKAYDYAALKHGQAITMDIHFTAMKKLGFK